MLWGTWNNIITDLRILASYAAKIAKICNFWTFWPVIQLINHLFKFRWKAFVPNTPEMGKVQWHFKSIICWLRWNCTSERLSFFTFSISALPLEVTSAMSLQFLHLWTIGKKKYVQIFERLCISSFIQQNVQMLCFKCPSWYCGW